MFSRNTKSKIPILYLVGFFRQNNHDFTNSEFFHFWPIFEWILFEIFLIGFFRGKMLWMVNRFVKICNEQVKRAQNLIPTFETPKSPYSREIWTFLWSYLTTRNNYAAWNKTWDMIKGVPFRSIFDAWKKKIIFSGENLSNASLHYESGRLAHNCRNKEKKSALLQRKHFVLFKHE